MGLIWQVIHGGGPNNVHILGTAKAFYFTLLQIAAHREAVNSANGKFTR